MKIRNKANKNTTKKTIKNNRGFTLIETLIAIVLVSLIGIPVFTVFSDTVGFTKKIKDLNHWNGELIKLERVLRKSVGEVQIPYWINNIEVTEGTGIMTIPYWNGDADLVLEMEIKDTTFKITTPEGSTVFFGYDGVEFDFLKDSRSGIVGLTILIKKTKREDVKFQCTFGSIGRDVFSEK
ncbi:MAG: prepilin-type N-terminal cleavage/methylation domain-containing protein [Spirochaetales bacterium]|nr:prepilin-type N-terminal cleavage/methylation domain-containing protein [Spirochaetales bacterium]